MSLSHEKAVVIIYIIMFREKDIKALKALNKEPRPSYFGHMLSRDKEKGRYELLSGLLFSFPTSTTSFIVPLSPIPEE